MNAKTMIPVLALLFIAATIGIASAYRGDPSAVGPNHDPELHEQIEAAIEARDYDAWIGLREANNLPTNGKIFQIVNKDNFGRFAEMHEAMLSGDMGTANTIRAELGLSQGKMNRGQGNGQMLRDGTGQGSMNRGAGNGGQRGTCTCPQAS